MSRGVARNRIRYERSLKLLYGESTLYHLDINNLQQLSNSMTFVARVCTRADFRVFSLAYIIEFTAISG